MKLVQHIHLQMKRGKLYFESFEKKPSGGFSRTARHWEERVCLFHSEPKDRGELILELTLRDFFWPLFYQLILLSAFLMSTHNFKKEVFPLLRSRRSLTVFLAAGLAPTVKVFLVLNF